MVLNFLSTDKLTMNLSCVTCMFETDLNVHNVNVKNSVSPN